MSEISRPLPQAVLTYLLCSFIILRRVHVEKEVLSARQVDQLCRPDPPGFDVGEKRPRSVLAARDQFFRFEQAKIARYERKIAGDDQRPISDAGAESRMNPAQRSPLLVSVRDYSQIRIEAGAVCTYERNPRG